MTTASPAAANGSRPADRPDLRVIPGPEIEATEINGVRLERADALDRYAAWPAPTVIVVDGPYGIGNFPGDPPTAEELPAAYAPHLEAWERFSLPETSLWFWGTELGWATMHPYLRDSGWVHVRTNIWDKGLAHIAGNVNSKTIRGYPVVTEVCVLYVRDVRLEDAEGNRLPMREWLRAEWRRSGLPLSLTNEAAGVRNAATRKWFTLDWRWYIPPPEALVQLAAYATAHGRPDGGRPYFSLDGKTPLAEEAWERMRSKWHHTHGVTNIWAEPAVRGIERLKSAPHRVHHNCQKPLRLMERIITASSDPGDVVWDPYAGLATGGVACLRTGRRYYGAEVHDRFYGIAVERLEAEAATLPLGTETGPAEA